MEGIHQLGTKSELFPMESVNKLMQLTLVKNLDNNYCECNIKFWLYYIISIDR